MVVRREDAACGRNTGSGRESFRGRPAQRHFGKPSFHLASTSTGDRNPGCGRAAFYHHVVPVTRDYIGREEDAATPRLEQQLVRKWFADRCVLAFHAAHPERAAVEHGDGPEREALIDLVIDRMIAGFRVG